MREIGIGLLGFGTVGAGVVRGLQENGALMAERIGTRLVLRKIADLDLVTDRGVTVESGILTTDAHAVVESPDVDVVVELIGGTGIARDLVLKALRNGKAVVTANKALLAEHGAEIFGCAAREQADLYFGASVGGGIPIIRALREGLVANGILSIKGILNGTCNYILTKMETEGLAFDKVLADAQELGFAESDPTLDVDGHDTAHKAVILASLAYGLHVPMEAVAVSGIRDVSAVDIRYAHDLGYRLKLLAVIKAVDGQVEVRVHPALVPLDHMLASVSGVFNAVMVKGDFVGDTLYYGRGAGQDPTASTVLGDICDVALNLGADATHRLPAVALAENPPALRAMDDVETRYYLRLSVLDRPGVVSEFSSILGSRGISIASVLQKEIGAPGKFVPVVILTHQVAERDLVAAVAEIDASDFVDAATVWYRIEE